MRNRTFFTALLIGALTVAGCSTVASPDTYGNTASVTAEATSEDTGAGTSSPSSGSDAASTSSSGSSDTDQGSGSSDSSGANFSEDLSLGIEPAPASEVEAYGMMHCCIKFNKKCMCYSTIDGDCSSRTEPGLLSTGRLVGNFTVTPRTKTRQMLRELG